MDKRYLSPMPRRMQALRRLRANWRRYRTPTQGVAPCMPDLQEIAFLLKFMQERAYLFAPMGSEMTLRCSKSSDLNIK